MGKRLKDYLNSEETTDMAVLGKLIDMLDDVLKKWGEKGNLSTEEHKGFKTALTCADKAWKKVMDRMSDKGKMTYEKRQNGYYVYIYDREALIQAQKKVSDTRKELYKKEVHYYDMCGLIMEKHCLNCRQEQGKCDFAKEFEKNNVQEPIMEPDYDWKHCRYAYSIDDVVKLENEMKGKKVV